MEGYDRDVLRLARRIRVALGREPGDLVLRGGQVVNVFTREVGPANVVIVDGVIAGVGPRDYPAGRVEDVSGRFLLPGLIDAHLHVESTLLTPSELARLVVPRGTSAIVADPHEVGNVFGVAGIEALIAASEALPLDIFYMASSCVPAVPWEDAGATIGLEGVERLLKHPRVLGLAEMMNFPGVLAGDRDVLAKITAASVRGVAIDGHAPHVVGDDLIAYVAAGMRSDHESTQQDEARQKARLGMMVQVREGSSEHNLEELLPLLAGDALGEWCLATDDMHPDDLLRDGHLDARLRRLVEGGVDPVKAIRHASLVAARHYGLRDRGAIAPGYRADIVAVDDLAGFRVRQVVHGGRVVARDGRCLVEIPPSRLPASNSVHLPNLTAADFTLNLPSGVHPVVAIVEGQIVTTIRHARYDATTRTWSDPADVAFLACVERHKATAKVGLGLVTGLTLTQAGALGSSVAHDSHNLIIGGTNPEDMLLCAQALAETGGGFVVCSNGRVLARLPLPFAGLISTSPFETVCAELGEVNAAARSLGCRLHSPFGTLSFLALPVIPALRVCARGVFDVDAQRFLTFDRVTS